MRGEMWGGPRDGEVVELTNLTPRAVFPITIWTDREEYRVVVYTRTCHMRRGNYVYKFEGIKNL